LRAIKSSSDRTSKPRTTARQFRVLDARRETVRRERDRTYRTRMLVEGAQRRAARRVPELDVIVAREEPNKALAYESSFVWIIRPINNSELALRRS
jgi:hypothetical protein